MTASPDPHDVFAARQTIATPLGQRVVYNLNALKNQPWGANLDRLPYSIKVLLEACLRHLDGCIINPDHIQSLASYTAKKVGAVEIPFMPGRVVLQDFTGVPCVVDLAAMRAAIVKMHGDPRKVNPLVPCDLVIDHSVQVDAFGSPQALAINGQLEFERNSERYALLKWAQKAFANFRAVPPATGIIHQVNLEYLAKVVWEGKTNASLPVLYPDSCVGTDSHTTMINGLGVLGWGVGGIEAEAVMLGQPYYLLMPEVVGVRLTGKLREGTTATDLVLRVTEILRKLGVVNKFVEYFGPGLAEMPLANRATIANMAPEYGATCGFFPVDEQTLKYLHLTGRDEKLVATVEQYCKLNGLWRNDAYPIEYSTVVEFDLASVEPSLAGPKRPQDRVALTALQSQWRKQLATAYGRSGVAANGQNMASEGDTATACVDARTDGVEYEHNGQTVLLKHGAVVIAAITSCTNTSNPDVLVAAGLVARKAVARGLKSKPWVKTSLAPGSKVATEYLANSDLLTDLEALGFHVVGYGCTTCIGNSGPLPEEVGKAIAAGDLVVASVLSGNRNFEGRVHSDVKANYLASPPLVVAYALAGTVDIDLAHDPLGTDQQGRPVYLKDIWPTQAEVDELVQRFVTRQKFTEQYADVFAGSPEWQAIPTTGGAQYQWDANSTYIQDPPYFQDMPAQPGPLQSIHHARCLVKVGDSVTTDHISPAGSIKKDSPAGKFLIEHGVPVSMFNSYGSRRGNDRVMTRGTFANTRIKNQTAPGTEGGWTTDYTDGQVKFIYDAAENYKQTGTPLIVLAGKDYGMGSSRDWAAKGTMLLGVKAVLAESFERIHRSNLVGMGVLPLCYQPGQTAAALGLQGDEIFDIDIPADIKPRQNLTVRVTPPPGVNRRSQTFSVTCRIDTPVEVEYYRHGGILQAVLRKMAK